MRAVLAYADASCARLGPQPCSPAGRLLSRSGRNVLQSRPCPSVPTDESALPTERNHHVRNRTRDRRNPPSPHRRAPHRRPCRSSRRGRRHLRPRLRRDRHRDLRRRLRRRRGQPQRRIPRRRPGARPLRARGRLRVRPDVGRPLQPGRHPRARRGRPLRLEGGARVHRGAARRRDPRLDAPAGGARDRTALRHPAVPRRIDGLRRALARRLRPALGAPHRDAGHGGVPVRDPRRDERARRGRLRAARDRLHAHAARAGRDPGLERVVQPGALDRDGDLRRHRGPRPGLALDRRADRRRDHRRPRSSVRSSTAPRSSPRSPRRADIDGGCPLRGIRRRHPATMRLAPASNSTRSPVSPARHARRPSTSM